MTSVTTLQRLDGTAHLLLWVITALTGIHANRITFGLCCFANNRAKTFFTHHRHMRSCENNSNVRSFEQETHVPVLMRVRVQQTNADPKHQAQLVAS
jgi:hypothetical protein